jgi:hypothetical protein
MQFEMHYYYTTFGSDIINQNLNNGYKISHKYGGENEKGQNCKRCGMEWPWPYLNYYPTILMTRLRKTKRTSHSG